MLQPEDEKFDRASFIRLVHPAIGSAVDPRQRPWVATAKNVGLRCWCAELEALGNLRLVPGEEPSRQCLCRVLQTEWRAGFADRLSPGKTSHPAADPRRGQRAVEEARRQGSRHCLRCRPRVEIASR